MRYLTGILLCIAAAAVAAHDARPNYVEVTETSPDSYLVEWKVPTTIPIVNLPEVVMPASCRESIQVSTRKIVDSLISRVRYECSDVLAGSELRIEYPLLNPSLTTMFKVKLINGQVHSTLLRPGENAWVVPETETRAGIARDYLALGIRHILGGIDHLLFVACLMFIARTPRRMLITITGFTLAHSLTLALAALGIVNVPIPPLEAAIALSILFLIVEIARDDRHSLAFRYPVAVSATFGLLHGFGFAAVLNQIGLPQTELVTGLLFFNIGVEIGQILFLLALFVAVALVRISLRFVKRVRTIDQMLAAVRTPATYVIGTVGGFWLIDRLAAF